MSVDQTSTDPAWHQDTYGAYGGSGQSWWMGDPSIGPNGGYLDHWYQVLDTPRLQIPAGAGTYTVIFDQKDYENLCLAHNALNVRQVVYDGWDAFNIRISADGEDMEILEDAFPLIIQVIRIALDMSLTKDMEFLGGVAQKQQLQHGK